MASLRQKLWIVSLSSSRATASGATRHSNNLYTYSTHASYSDYQPLFLSPAPIRYGTLCRARPTSQPRAKRLAGTPRASADTHEGQVRPRSGLAIKQGLTVLNAPGTIDADYRGELQVILINLSQETVEIAPGERIAQLVFASHEQCDWVEVESLSDTQRGDGGFGHTGV